MTEFYTAAMSSNGYDTPWIDLQLKQVLVEPSCAAVIMLQRVYDCKPETETRRHAMTSDLRLDERRGWSSKLRSGAVPRAADNDNSVGRLKPLRALTPRFSYFSSRQNYRYTQERCACAPICEKEDEAPWKAPLNELLYRTDGHSAIWGAISARNQWDRLRWIVTQQFHISKPTANCNNLPPPAPLSYAERCCLYVYAVHTHVSLCWWLALPFLLT